MTEIRYSLGGIILAAAAGLIAGLVVGLLLGFVVLPVRVTNVDIADLKPAAQEQYILLVAETYAYERDLARAKQRLAGLNDKDIKTRIGRIARTYEGKDEVAAARLASLAVALGAADSTLRVLAQRDIPPVSQGPTKFAQLAAKPTAPATATEPFSAETPVADPTNTPTATRPAATAGPTATSRPRATTPPTAVPAAPALPIQWLPDYPGQWWPTVKAAPATVTPGTQYWRLTRALYCDREDKRNNCQELPGGENDYSIYVTLLDASGKRTAGEVEFQRPDGSIAGTDETGPQKSLADMCNCNYSVQISSYNIRVKGIPSDSISGFCACSINSNWSARAHVRYFLTFQLTTR